MARGRIRNRNILHSQIFSVHSPIDISICRAIPMDASSVQRTNGQQVCEVLDPVLQPWVVFVQRSIDSDSNRLFPVNRRRSSAMAQQTLQDDGQTTGNEFSCPLRHDTGHVLNYLDVIDVKVDVVTVIEVVEDFDNLAVGVLQGVTGRERGMGLIDEMLINKFHTHSSMWET